MRTNDGKPIGEVPQKKDPYWWMHPAYRGEQALDLSTLNTMAEGAYRWVSFGSPEATEFDQESMRQPQGAFAEFAQLLYKVNNFKGGPVKDWYVIICTEADRRWAVGQLCADPKTPVLVFEDLVFKTEDEARAHAQTLREETAETLS